MSTEHGYVHPGCEQTARLRGYGRVDGEDGTLVEVDARRHGA